MKYSFRIRINRSSHVTIDATREKIPLSISGEESLCLHASPNNISIQNADKWSLIGSGYNSEDDAQKASKFFQDILTVTLAKMRIGADFGERSPKSGFFPLGIEKLEDKKGQRILNDVHGKIVYLSDPSPTFARLDASYVIGKKPELFEQEFLALAAKDICIAEHERVAFSLFNSSFFQHTQDSRFLLLVMSIEVLLTPQKKSQCAIGYVDKFIQQVQESSLSDGERQSLCGSLKWLKQESISSAGRRFVFQHLGDKLYHGMAAPKFFSKIYEIRSALVHGSNPYPSFEQIANVVADVEALVSDLLVAYVTNKAG